MSDEIFKVQIPLETNAKVPQALFYNRDRSIRFQTSVSPEIMTLMAGAPKKFFYARIDQTTGMFEVTGEAPAQTW